MNSAKCYEPGQGMAVIVSPADGPRDFSGFIDQNTYCYRMQGDAVVLRGIIMGKGWENREFRPEKLSCYRQKGDGEMPFTKRQAPPREELQRLWDKYEGKINPIRKELKSSWGDARKWLEDAGILGTQAKSQYKPEDNDFTCKDEAAGKYQTEQTPPEPVQAANQEPGRENGESASDSIPQKINPYGVGKPGEIRPIKMPLGQELPREDEIKPVENLLNIAVTSGGVKKIDPGQHREPWEEDCIVREQVESWLLDTYRLDVSKARKMEILGKLLDMEVGA